MRLDELHRLGRVLQDIALAEMSSGNRAGMSPAELVVVRDLFQQSPSTISEISSRTGFAHSRVSTAVASLRDRGWVATSTDPADRRRTLVTLAQTVREGAATVRARDADRALAEALAVHPPARRAELVRALEEIGQALQRHADRDQAP
jgi:DNA-binding MarR family transcriptional regulator